MVPEMSSTIDTIFCHLGQFFAHLPPENLKNQNFEKILKNPLEILSFYTSVPKIMIIWYTVPEIWCMTNVIVIFNVGLFFALLPPNSPKNQDITILHMCTKNYDQMMYGFWEMVCNRRMDGTKKWHMEVGASPRK